MTELEYATRKLAEQKARIRHLERIVEWFLYEDDCPRRYHGNVWCSRMCPVWGRHDVNSEYYCTKEEIMERVEKEIAND